MNPYSSSFQRNKKGDILAESFNYDEFSMGAEPVVFVLKTSILGTQTFITTNGKIELSHDEDEFFLHDACTVLKINIKDKKVSHWLRPKPYYISDFQQTEEGFVVKLYGGKPYSKTHIYEEINWKSGFGDVKKGKFPSTHKPALKRIKIPPNANKAMERNFE